MFDYSNKLKLMRDMQSLQRIKNVELYAMRLLRAARWIKARISRRLDIPVGCFVLLCATDCFAQRGTNLKEPVAAVGTLALPVPKFQQQYFGWSAPAGSSNKVSWGLSRNAWTNGSAWVTNTLRFTNGVGAVFTNAFPWTNNWHYKVTAMVAGVESIPALWPSNRIGGDIWLVGYATNMTQPTNIVKLLSYKGNNPPGNMRFWGVIDLTTGWE